MAVCNNSIMVAIYNKTIFLSPDVDGPMNLQDIQ